MQNYKNKMLVMVIAFIIFRKNKKPKTNLVINIYDGYFLLCGLITNSSGVDEL